MLLRCAMPGKMLRALTIAMCATSMGSVAAAGDIGCEESRGLGSKVVCYAVRSFVLVAGASQQALSSLKSAAFLATRVKVELDDGRQISADLTAKAAEGRIVNEGDLLKLKCVGAPRLEAQRAFLCQLEFTREDPTSPTQGKQSSWSIELHDSGKTDERLLILDEPAALPR